MTTHWCKVTIKYSYVHCTVKNNKDIKRSMTFDICIIIKVICDRVWSKICFSPIINCLEIFAWKKLKNFNPKQCILAVITLRHIISRVNYCIFFNFSASFTHYYCYYTNVDYIMEIYSFTVELIVTWKIITCCTNLINFFVFNT